jgi:phosphonopyruvate decarboxylase
VISARVFLSALERYDVGLCACVPCSILKPFVNYVLTDDSLHYIGAVSEGEAVGIAAGSTLAGKTGVVMLQNSGLGNVVNPVATLTNIYGIPCLFIVSLRGEPGKNDAPQHSFMGRITYDLLDLMSIYWQDFPGEQDEAGPALERAFGYMADTGLPAAFVIRANSVEPFDPELPLRAWHPTPAEPHTIGKAVPSTLTRRRAIEHIVELLEPCDLVISTTGMISRDLFDCCDRPRNFYMQGSMGTATAIGLGIVLIRPYHRLVVLDGDGALLMRMGSLATVGYYQPRYFLHVVLDNGSYDTTGGQPTSSPAVDFPGVALASGYRRAATVHDSLGLDQHGADFHKLEGPSMLHVRITRDPGKRVGRPTITPWGIRTRFMESINE